MQKNTQQEGQPCVFVSFHLTGTHSLLVSLLSSFHRLTSPSATRKTTSGTRDPAWNQELCTPHMMQMVNRVSLNLIQLSGSTSDSNTVVVADLQFLFLILGCF